MARAIRLVLFLVGILGGFPGLAGGQPGGGQQVGPRPAGWYVYPSLSLGGRYDDNIFDSAGSKTGDFITFASGTLTGGYESLPLTLLGAYTITAELYADNSELNNLGDNQSARLLFSYRPDLRWTLGLTADFERLASPGQVLQRTTSPPTITPATGPTAAPTTAPTGATGIPVSFVPAVDVGRTDTTLIEVGPTVSYVIDTRTNADAGYLYTRSEVGDDVTTSHEARFSIARRLTTRDEGSLNYVFRYFTTPDDQAEEPNQTGSEDLISHTITLGWIRELTPLMTMRLAAGPSFSENDLGIDFEAGIERRLRTGFVGVTYHHTQGVVVGIQGAANVDEVLAHLTFAPCRLCAVTLNASFGYFDQIDGGEDYQVYSGGVNFSYRLTEWLSATAYYTFSYQDSEGSVTTNNIVSIQLDFTYPYRIR